MHAFTPFYSPFTPFALGSVGIFFILIVVVWTVVLKGFALWYAARGSQKGWFVALLIINTLGILEIIYLIWFRPKHSLNEPAPIHTSSSAQ